MPVSRMDEFLAHQTPDTFDRVFTSDRNFYDRHYFNAHGSSPELFLVGGLGLYPNLGVIDAFVTVSVGEEQHTVRASRELHGDRLDTSVGPFRIEVIEPLVSLRFVCEPNEWQVAFDLTWRGSIAPLEEPRFSRRQGARIFADNTRYAQVGTWEGSLEVHDSRFAVTPDRWRGARDRSWGVRPVGEPEPAGIHAKPTESGPMGLYHHWIPMQFDDCMLKIMVDEDAHGRRVTEEAMRVWNVGQDRESEELGSPQLQVEWIEGTRELASARVSFTGGKADAPKVVVTPLRTVYMNSGSGYVYDGHWGHGVYQGGLLVEGVTHDLGDAAARKELCGLNETLCRFDADDGRVGYGLHENMVLGAHLPSGFEADDEAMRRLRG